MPLGGNIGNAVIAIGADSGEFNAEANEQLGRAGRSGGSRFGAALKKVAKRGAQATAIAVGASLVGGIKSAIGQDTAKRVLTGLYGSQKQAVAMMKSLRQVSKNSPLSYDSYTKAAQSLAYAGVKGKDATKTLKNVGLAITAAGGDSEQLQGATDAVLKMVNAGKVQMDSLQQLSNNGVPILSGLAKHFGVSIDKVNEMASKGQIKLDDVMSVMKNGTGKTFKSMIKSGLEAQKSFGNTWKAMKDRVVTSIGAGMVPVMEKLAPVLATVGNGVSDFIDGMTNGTGVGGQFVDIIKATVAALMSVVDWFKQNKDAALALGIAVGTVTTGLLLYNTYTKIAANWTKIMTAAQKALNLVMKASLIGVITIALAALVLGLIQAYKHSETFRKIVQAVWSAIKVAVSATVTWITTVAWPALQKAFQWIGDKAIWLWQKVIQPAWSGISAAISFAWSSVIKPVLDVFVTFLKKWVAPTISWLYSNIVKPVFGWISKAIQLWWNYYAHPILKAFQLFLTNVVGPVVKWLYNSVIKPVFGWIGTKIKQTWDHMIHPALLAFKRLIDNGVGPTIKWLYNSIVKPVFGWIGSKVHSVWTGLIRPAFNGIKSGARAVGTAFSKAKDAVKRAWDKLGGIVKKPIQGALNISINPLINGINALIPGPGPLKTIHLATGGPVPGFSPTSTSDNIPIMATADEHMIRQKSARSMRSHYPGWLEHVNRYGQPPGYAGGGRIANSGTSGGGAGQRAWSGSVWYRPWMKATLAREMARLHKQGWTVLEFPPYDRVDPVHMKGSLHYKGQAADISRPGMRGADGVARMLENAGLGVIWRAPGHFNHIHADTGYYSNFGSGFKKNKGGGGGGFDLLAPVKNLFNSTIGKVAKKFAGNDFAKLPIALGKKAASSLWGWAKDKALQPVKWVWDKAKGVGSWIKDRFSGGTDFNVGDMVGSALVNRWKPVASRALKETGLSQSYLPLLLHRMQVESGGNPNAVNRWDSNWLMGNPSQGLMQVIPTTFAAYAGKYAKRGIRDPLANIYAAIRYTLSRYGFAGIKKAWGGKGGYASGTLSASPGWHLAGENGPEWYKFRGGETVLPNGVNPSAATGGPSIHIDNLMISADTLDGVRSAQEFMEWIQGESMRSRLVGSGVTAA